MKVLVHFSASKLIGAGHAMRCLTVVDYLMNKGVDVVLHISQQTFEFIPVLSDYECVFNLPDLFEFEYALIDNPQSDLGYQEKLAAHNLKVVVIDDFAKNSYDCDVLINPNLGYSVYDYNGKIPEKSKVLVGIQYCLVGNRFRKIYRQRSIFRNLLFYFGGAGIITPYVELMLQLKASYDIGIVLGFRSDISVNDSHLSDFVVFESHQIEEAYKWADFSVGYAGQGMFERYVAGIPMVIYSQNSEQDELLRKISCPSITYQGLIQNMTVDKLSSALEDLFKTSKNYEPLDTLLWVDEVFS